MPRTSFHRPPSTRSSLATASTSYQSLWPEDADHPDEPEEPQGGEAAEIRGAPASKASPGAKETASR